jgi:hypothetical protein
MLHGDQLVIVRVCPKCRGTNIHRSRRHGPEYLMAFFLLRPFRCNDCEKRFWSFLYAKTLAARKHKPGAEDPGEILADDPDVPSK